MELRMTNQREMILAELRKSKNHLTADELYELVKKYLPRISLATVYRNLEILSEAGMIQKLEIGGRQKRFDAELSKHDHIYCIECHRIDNLKIEGKDSIFPDVNESFGYTISGCRLEFKGLCPDCQKKQQQIKGDTKMGCGCKTTTLNDEQKKVLEAMEKCDGPCASKDIAAATGLETKSVSCKITALKKKGYVESPVRCKYEITSDGRDALKA